MINLSALLKAMVDKNASDIHLRVGIAPTLRVNGDLFRAQMAPITVADMTEMINAIMNEEQRAAFEKNREFDFAFGLPGVGRFRINAFRQRGTPALAIRSIRTQIPAFSELNLPSVILDIAMKTRGLILCSESLQRR